MSLVSYLRTILKLGVISVLKVLYYKVSLKFKLNSVFRIKAQLIDEPIYRGPQKIYFNLPIVDSWEKGFLNNSFIVLPIQNQPPDWFYNQFTNTYSKCIDKVWSEIKDFDDEVGDIKAIWEISRFDWIIPISQQASKGDANALSILNGWLMNWQMLNKPYLGVNWKCGQESSIRVIHLIMGAYILDQLDSPNIALVNLVIAHLKRIEPTILYAIGQNNNHGTSEAAALFIGGAFLVKNGYQIGRNWQHIGGNLITERISKLIGENGTFSQYSLNYHRLMLDTLCCCEIFRVKFNLPLFPTLFYEKSVLATNWLFNLTDSVSGDGPNIGANDGAKIIPLTNCGYRDFRPTIQLATVLFKSERAYPEGIWDDQFRWLKMEIPKKTSCRPNKFIANDGGFAVLNLNNNFICLKYPRFKFRPSQNDSLHLDLWVKGLNVFKDAGSYSYNSNPILMNYFGSVSAHNTIQFDGYEPMKKISRFLYGNWLKTNWISEFKEVSGSLSFGAGYTDDFGAKHKRSVILYQNKLEVIDEIQDFKNYAIMRWRLKDEKWNMFKSKNKIYLNSNSGKLMIEISCNEEIIDCNIVEGFESLFYMKYNIISVLELRVKKNCKLITIVDWKIDLI
jgi:hypothetical protein